VTVSRIFLGCFSALHKTLPWHTD